jgi:hypothetical protein
LRSLTASEYAAQGPVQLGPAQDQSDEEPSRREDTVQWLCDAGVADFALIFFTYCLVIVGWATIRSGQRTAADIERALVFLGTGAGSAQVSTDRRHRALTANNTGRSPAFGLEYFVRFSPIEPSDKNPKYRREGQFFSETTSLIVPPGKETVFLALDINAIDQPYMFGYIKYTDIFHKQHTNRFSIRFDVATGAYSAVGPSAWNSWD